MDWYRTAARPVLFALPPETAHRVALRLLGLPLPWERLGRPDRDPALATTFAGIPLANPIGLAAGFDKSGRRLGALGRVGFGFVVGGTFTRRPRRGNPTPRIVRYRDRASLVNSMGLPNPGAEAAARNLEGTPRTAPRFASIADEGLADALEAHALLEPHVDGVELNASCPNVAWGRDRDDEGNLAALVRALGERRSTPLIVKLAPFRTPAEREGVLALAKTAVEAGADALTCSNTRSVAEVSLSTGRGGLSGRAMRADTPRIVAEVAEAIDRAVPIAACGGVGSPADARACLDAGAAVVGELTAGLAGSSARRGPVPTPAA
jgi:dihydroorotate dehydrogenase